ncbi:MAG: insulinase family protein [Clostridiales Family XIII bacterium]|jgi:predicted Zn-dependent peptidase|nr:insulinase family protein [Clostridiales Family XIII bacterium]
MIKKVNLKNGITVLLERTAEIGSFAFACFFNVGSVDENDDNNGISHLIEHMFFKGTKKRTYKDIADDVDKIGGSINAFTSKELTCYYIKTLKDEAENAIEIISDIVSNSIILKKELNKEKKVILEEMKMTEDYPDELAHEKLSEFLFNGTAYEKPIIGYRKTIQNQTREKILAYIKKFYTAENLLITCFGNFNEKKIINSLEKYFSKMKGKRKPENYPTLNYKSKIKVINKDIKQSHIALGIPTFSIFDKRRFAMSIYTEILGGSMSSRLFQNLREKKGLCYSVGSMTAGNKCTGSLIIYAGVSDDNIERSILAIKEELHSLANEGITDKEFEKAKTSLISSFVFSRENLQTRMFQAGKNFLNFGKVEKEETILRKIKVVKKEEVEKIARDYADTNKYSLSIVSARKIKNSDIKKCL